MICQLSEVPAIAMDPFSEVPLMLFPVIRMRSASVNWMAARATTEFVFWMMLPLMTMSLFCPPLVMADPSQFLITFPVTV